MPIKSPIDVIEHQKHWHSAKPLIIKELGIQLLALNEIDNQVELEVLIGNSTLKGANIKKKFQAAGIPKWRKPVTPVIKKIDGLLIFLPYEKAWHGFKMKAI